MKKFTEVALVLAILLLTASVSSAQAQTGETVYVSTFTGHQILAVDSITGATRVIYTGASDFIPEGIVVGQDDKIYAFSSDSSQIWRMNRDRSQPEKIYDATSPACSDTACPIGPEGPSVSTAGDLFFNTRDGSPTGVWKLAGIFSVPFGGPFPLPHQVLTNAAVPNGTGSAYGEGTIFDSTDALLVVDRLNSVVVRSVSPFTTTSTFISATDPGGSGTPVGIGVDSAGDVFVANTHTQNIGRFSSTGSSLGAYFTFSGIDRPFYHKFDAANTLFVASNDGTGTSGKVWRIDPSGFPPSSGSGTVLIDLEATYSACSPNPSCLEGSPVPGLASGQAVGLALPATTFTTGPQTVAPGTTTNFTDGNVINQAVQIPPDANMGDVATMQMSFIQFAPAVFNSTRLTGTQGNTFSGGNPGPFSSPPTTCTPIAGTGGNCVVMEAKCFTSGGALLPTCNITAGPTSLIQLTSHYETLLAPQPNPGLLIADDVANNWANIINEYSDCCTIGGGTKGTQMDTVIVDLGGTPPPTDTAAPTITATTFPAPNGAGWNNTSPVSVILNAKDDQLINNITYSATGAQTIASTTVFAASTFFPIANQGSTLVSFCATDNANLETCGTLTVKIDTTPPTIAITTPAKDAVYTLNQVVKASYTCTDPIPSGVNLVSGVVVGSCMGPVANGANIDTASAGVKTFTVTARDVAGNPGTATVKYTVVYPPVNLDVFGTARSTVRPGSTITYFITALNLSQKNVASGVVVTDTVPAGTTVVGTPFFCKSIFGCWIPSQRTSCMVSGSGTVVTCDIGSLAPLNTGAAVGIAIVVNVPSTTPLNTLLTDTATATSLNPDTDGLDNSVTIKTKVVRSTSE